MKGTSAVLWVIIMFMVVIAALLAWYFFFVQPTPPPSCVSDMQCKTYGSDYVCRQSFCVKASFCNGNIPIINWLGCVIGV